MTIGGWFLSENEATFPKELRSLWKKDKRMKRFVLSSSTFTP